MFSLLLTLACTPPLEKAETELEPALHALEACAGEDLAWIPSCHAPMRDVDDLELVLGALEEAVAAQPESVESHRLLAIFLTAIAPEGVARHASLCLSLAEDEPTRRQCTNLLRAAQMPRQHGVPLVVSVRDGSVWIGAEALLPWPVPAGEKRGQMISRLYDHLLESAETSKDLAARSKGEREFTGELTLDLQGDLRLTELSDLLYTVGQAQYLLPSLGTPGHPTWERLHFAVLGPYSLGKESALLNRIYPVRGIEHALRLTLAEGRPVEAELFFLPRLEPPPPGPEYDMYPSVHLAPEECALAPDPVSAPSALAQWNLTGTRLALRSDLPMAELLPVLQELREAGWTEVILDSPARAPLDSCEEVLRSPDQVPLAEARWYGGHQQVGG